MELRDNRQQEKLARFALVTAQNCFLYEEPGDDAGGNKSEITDEIFSGWAVRIMGTSPEKALARGCAAGQSWLWIETHYGYKGYVKAADLRELTASALRERQDRTRYFLLRQAAVDVLAQPKVQGQLLETVLRGSILELVEDEPTVSEKNGTSGWCLVRTAAGQVGYLHAHFLAERKDDDGYLLRSVDVIDVKNMARAESYFNEMADRVLAALPENELRERLVESAMAYMGTQYRWAGKSSQGIDCSGLTFMSYMENGFLLYRDAWIRENHPVREIQKEELGRGDLIFFEGHVAMYLGEGRFIHATGYAQDSKVTVNSLVQGDPLYRPDLPEKILWYGSVFRGVRCTRTKEEVGAVLEANRAGVDLERITFTGDNPEISCAGTGNSQSGQQIGSDAGKPEGEDSLAQKEESDLTQKKELPGKALKETITDSCKNSIEGVSEENVLTHICTSITNMGGSVSFYYQNLETGAVASHEPDTPHIAASVIKLYLMAALFQGFADGDFTPEEKLTVPAGAKVPSCGVLHYLDDGKELSIRDLIELMIIVSDNTATNILFDFYEGVYGPERLNRVIAGRLGFAHTSFNRKMFDSERAAQGIENYTTVGDTAMLLARLYQGELVSAEASRQMYDILKDQRLNGKIPFILHTLAPSPVIAHKTGEDSGTTHDVAVIEGIHPMVLCFMGNDVDVPALERLMAEAAAELYALG